MLQPPEQRPPTFIRYDPLTATAYFNDTNMVGAVIPSDIGEPRLAIEGDIHLAIFPTISSCIANLQYLPNDVYNGFEAVADNIDAWRLNLVSRIKQYASTINDLQSTANSASYSSDLNAQSVSVSVSARLDQFAERLNQQDQSIAVNCNKIQSLLSSLDQFKITSETQFLSLKDQLLVLSEFSVFARLSSPPLPSVEVADVEQTVVIEGL